MENKEPAKQRKLRLFIKRCHVCGEIMESQAEIRKCQSCGKSFLPLRYFEKIQAKNTQEFYQLFSASSDIDEDDLIKGIHVLW